MSRTSVDIAIVGAGAAGLAAARAARERGHSFVVFEALPRIGGRAYTRTDPFGVPWDVGCHWLHSASINPMRDLADRYGFRYRQEPPGMRMALDGRWASEEEAAEAEAFLDRSYAAIDAAATAGRDVALSEVVDLSSRWIRRLRGSVNAEWGVDLDQTSTVDAIGYRDTHENWPVQDGYGALVARHAQGIAVELATPVTRIAWGSRPVRVETARGTIEAGAVVVTASTSALAAGAIAFDPPLPAWKQEAFDAVPLGNANKVVLQLDGGLDEVPDHSYVVAPLGDRYLMGFQIKPFGTDLANGFLSGPLGSELERQGEAAMVDAALEALASAFGSRIRQRVVRTACSRWESEPTIRGGYAAARPGQAHRRADLGRPLENRLFFAGEATSPEFYSTCHGAHMTGIVAAEAASAALHEPAGRGG